MSTRLVQFSDLINLDVNSTHAPIMKATIIEYVRRGSRSTIAERLAGVAFSFDTEIVVAQNAPRYYKFFDYKEIDRGADLQSLCKAGYRTCIWLKTATLGGRSRLYVKYAEVKK